MLHEIIIAGFGGQGVMSMGQLLVYSGLQENRQVSWLPSYGPEQRGGTANCSVIVSDQEVASPIFSRPEIAIVLNTPSFDKYEPLVREGGTLIVNSSLVEKKSSRTDINIVEIPASSLAADLGVPKVANSIILGVLLGLTNIVSLNSVLEALKKVLPERRHNLIPANKIALEEGIKFVK